MKCFYQKAIIIYASLAQRQSTDLVSRGSRSQNSHGAPLKFFLAKRCLFSIFGIEIIVSYI